MPSPKKSFRQAGHAAPRPTIDEILASGSRFHRVSADFLKVDVETALTFTTVALQSEDKIKRERNRKAARKAFETIQRLMKKVQLSAEDSRFLESNLERLRSDLMRLGEAF